MPTNEEAALTEPVPPRSPGKPPALPGVGGGARQCQPAWSWVQVGGSCCRGWWGGGHCCPGSRHRRRGRGAWDTSWGVLVLQAQHRAHISPHHGMEKSHACFTKMALCAQEPWGVPGRCRRPSILSWGATIPGWAHLESDIQHAAGLAGGTSRNTGYDSRVPGPTGVWWGAAPQPRTSPCCVCRNSSPAACGWQPFYFAVKVQNFPSTLRFFARAGRS